MGTPAQSQSTPVKNQTGGETFTRWLAANRRTVSFATTVLVLIGFGVWFFFTAKIRRETFATNSLDAARFSVETGNLTLAASDLSDIVATYSGTAAGQEAIILLARVRVQQGQPDVAVSELRTFIASSPVARLVAPANGLLGGALEQLGQFGEAATAFEAAAAASQYDLLRADYFMDAGRAAALSGDTARAAVAYQNAADAAGETSGRQEALFRLGELGI